MCVLPLPPWRKWVYPFPFRGGGCALLPLEMVGAPLPPKRRGMLIAPLKGGAHPSPRGGECPSPP